MRVIIGFPLRGRPNIIKHGFVTTHADVEVSGQTVLDEKLYEQRFQYGRM